MTQNIIAGKTHKLIIYQIFTRLFGNTNLNNKRNGSIAENGSGKLNDINSNALKSIKELGISHVWYTGIIEHATTTDYSGIGIVKDHPEIVKGRAGSPYAIKDYYDIDPDLAANPKKRMVEFESLVKRTHKEDLKVIIDFIPNHLARQYHSDVKPESIKDFGEGDDQLKEFDANNNFYYIDNKEFKIPNGLLAPLKSEGSYHERPAKATGNDVFSASPSINDWFETIKLNYGVDYKNHRKTHFNPIPDTWLKMKNILLYWAAKGVDGFRCDMAEMVPVEFWEWLIKEVKEAYPETLFIAEIYKPQTYYDYIHSGGFDYLYDKVGLYDALRRLIEGHGSANDITKVWQEESGQFSQHMLRFLENHDEQRIASKEFAGDALKALPAMALSAFLHTGPLMVYFGQELGVNSKSSEGFQGNDGRSTIFDYWGVKEMAQWNNKGQWNLDQLSSERKELRKRYQKIISFSKENKAVSDGHFFDLQHFNQSNVHYDEHKVYSFLRYSEGQRLLFVFNFDQEASHSFSLKIPELAWRLMNVKATIISIKRNKSNAKQSVEEPININIRRNAWQVFQLI